MSVFAGHAKSLSQSYVYYDRVGDYYPTLKRYVTYAGYRMIDQTKKYNQDGSQVRAHALAELAKEKALLSEHFGVNISFEEYYYTEDGVQGFKEIIDALNSALNLKEIYERNMQLIKHTKGMKGVYSWYPTYFMKAWDHYWPRIKEEFERKFKKGEDSTDILDKLLDKYIPDICVLGIEKMLDGPEVESSKIDPQLKDAYSQLVSQIGSIKTQGSMANQIYRAYQLEELKETILKSFEVENGHIYAKKLRPKVEEMVSANIHSRGGLTLEAIEHATLSLVSDRLSKEKGIKAKAIHSGATQIKADNIITIGLDPTIVVEALEQAGGNREENITALTELGEKIKNLDSGFIVYSSDKNYTLNSDFSGYGAGSVGATAESFLKKVYKNSSSLDTLIGTIQQFGKGKGASRGAILEGKEEEFEILLAQDIAYMLFDDYSTIGQADAGGRAVHIMNLNGIMIPLSVILTLLADAIDGIYVHGNGGVRRIVSVDIKAPKILYENDQEQFDDFPDDTHAAWEKQRQEALNNTKISAKFLRNFKQLINLYL